MMQCLLSRAVPSLQKGVKYPSEMRKYNRLPLLPCVSVGGKTIFPGVSAGGVGMGGVADYTLLPQTATVVLGTGGTIYQGAKLTGYGLYSGGKFMFDVGDTIINNAELMPEGGGLVGWRF